jgi:hypothetical protein
VLLFAALLLGLSAGAQAERQETDLNVNHFQDGEAPLGACAVDCAVCSTNGTCTACANRKVRASTPLSSPSLHLVCFSSFQSESYWLLA